MESINSITGVGTRETEALARADIYTTAQLLLLGATSVGRMRIADESGLADAQIKSWVHIVDLLRVDGMTPDLAKLLCEIGVLTVPKLAFRSPDTLRVELIDRAAHHHKTNIVPDAPTLERMVNRAKHLPKVVEH